jgi:hypothetical protein
LNQSASEPRQFKENPLITRAREIPGRRQAAGLASALITTLPTTASDSSWQAYDQAQRADS